MIENRLPLIAFIALLASACSRLTQENYERLKPGMTYDEVEQILGRPAKCSEIVGVKSCLWGNEQSNINANFVGDKAILYGSQNIR